jgi:hypothetical protein
MVVVELPCPLELETTEVTVAKLPCPLETIEVASQYQGKLKEREDVMFAWMELHQFIFHHLENWCSCDTDSSWRENISIAR